MEVGFVASDAVAEALARLGRTEDVAFSPDDRHLALCGFNRNTILLIDVTLEASASGMRVALTDGVELTSPGLRYPHGVSFLDDRTLVVTNRGGWAVVLRVPAERGGNEPVNVPALRTLRGGWPFRLRAPGSVCVSPLAGHLVEVLICNNYSNRVTRHVLDADRDFRVTRSRVLIHQGLSTPDGVDIDRERRWIAVSNHHTHSILMFENTPALGPRSEASATLLDIDYPHGVRFAAGGELLLAADAGAPRILVYAKKEDGWRGEHRPVRSVRVMDDATFQRGHANPEEGGPKGIDVDGGARVLASTCEQQVLAFFDLSRMVSPPEQAE